MAAFGSMLLNDNVESIIKANDICNRHGLDTMSTGCVIAFATQCYEEGLITQKDTDGLELTWGNHEAIVALTERIASREGFGDVLADGVKLASERIGRGSEEYAVHFHGQEPAMHDPRFIPGIAITYQIDATPGRHTQGLAWALDLGRGWKDSLDIGEFDPDTRYTYRGKGEAHWKLANMMHVVNSSGVCLFGFISSEDTQHLPEFLTSVTGWELDLSECYKIGERIGVLRLLFNLREGLNPLSFDVPDVALGRPPQEDGPAKDVTVDHDTQLADYLAAAGLDPVTAMPSRERLAALGLSDEAEAVKSHA